MTRKICTLILTLVCAMTLFSNIAIAATNVAVPITDTSTSTAPVQTQTPKTTVPAATAPKAAAPVDNIKTDLEVPDVLEIKPVSMVEFENHVMKKMAEIVATLRRVSTPYMYFSFVIGAFILILPFQSPLKKYAGWTTIFTTLVAYLLIWYGPVLLGVVRGFASP